MRSNEKLARPNICLFSIFTRLTWPSQRPEFQFRVSPVKLLLALLSVKNADVRYINGRVTAGVAGALHGEQKTDARDAYAIATALRVNPDAPRITSSDPVQEQLKLLVARRNDLVQDRNRLIWRLQDLLTSISPALERVLDLTNKGPVLLLMRWRTPAMLRRAGRERILQELRDHRIHLRAQLPPHSPDGG